MVDRNFKLRYRRSALGYLWTLLVPLSTAAIYYFLFKIILKVQMPHFAAFISTGVLVWTFFAGTLTDGMDSILSNFSLLLQVNIPLNLFPMTISITNVLTLLFAAPVIMGICLLNGVHLGLPALCFFFYVALLFVQAFCLSYVLAICVIYVRDLKQAISPALQIWMYGTPILYEFMQLPEKYRWILWANPVGKIFSGIHNCLLRNLWPTWAEIGTPVIWTSIIFSITLVIHAKASKQAIERI